MIKIIPSRLTKILMTLTIALSFHLSAREVRKETYLIRNMENTYTLPRNFRTTQQTLPENTPNPPSMLGLAQLKASGSSQFSENSLKKVIETIPSDNIIIVDLREEPHAMLDGMAITWYSYMNWTNTGLSKEEIDADLALRISALMQNPPNFIYTDKYAKETVPLNVSRVYTEQEAVESLGLGYVRIYARDHVRASDEAIDDFIQFVLTMDPDSWLHFHCSAGRGRTSAFMTLYDIMRNGDKVSFGDIIRRQHLIGGIDLFEILPEDEFKFELALERGKLILDFYQYYLENPQFSVPWSVWIAKKRYDESIF